ncbi:MipA/OmpV family protein [Desulforhopalus sp. IMCC35007]|uniref:MipA/OmpV family protein n=1 Tax=Desulforhopalus sp. IMCC35007 TaxID=2569543 RepID=UPI00145CAA0C|nr:MipA/OmpV family protein [Desulforhopalus sp. IMCC35007]
MSHHGAGNGGGPGIHCRQALIAKLVHHFLSAFCRLTMRFSSHFLVSFLSVVWSVSASLAGEEMRRQEKLPLYEYGIVGLTAQLPDYRGSDEYTTYAFPLPYFVYRGERLKASRDGVRGIFWRNRHVETDLSFSGNPPVSTDNEARAGMGELDGLVEVGPALRYYFYEYGERDSFFIQWNIRAAFSFGFDSGLEVSYQGLLSDVSLVFGNASLFHEQNIRFHLSTGPQFADSGLHGYFYEVAPQFVTGTRERYSAESGYGGWQLSGSVVKELTPEIWLSLYGRWMNSTGAVFTDSPLVETENNYVIGTLLVWKFGESDELER